MIESQKCDITAQYSNYRQKLDNFIILCDQHDSMVYQVGKHNYCSQNACLCRRKCKNQKQKHRSDRHDYIPAKKFIKDLDKLKFDYCKFKDNVFKNLVPIFIEKLRGALKQIQKNILKRFEDEENLSSLYFSMGIQGSDIVRDLLCEKTQNWDLEKLTCKDIHSLYSALQSDKSSRQQSSKYWQDRIFKNLKSYILEFMLERQLLPALKTQEAKQKVSITVDQHYFQDIKKRLESKMKNNAIRTQLEGKNFDRFIIKVHQKIQQTSSQKQNSNFLLKNAETQLFFKSIETFVTKYRPNTIVFAFKFQINRNAFWERMYNFISKYAFFRELQIYSSETCVNDYYIRQLKLFNSQIKVKDSYNVQWDNIENKKIISEEKFKNQIETNFTRSSDKGEQKSVQNKQQKDPILIND